MSNQNINLKEWTADGLLDEIKKLDANMPDRALAFILGAGASVTSGIPAGGALAQTWLKETHLRECLTPDNQEIESWAAKKLNIDNFRFDDAATHYSKIFELRFGDDPKSGYAALEAKMEEAEPNIGYSILAKILAETRHKVVVTTNFDNLVADALAINALKPPLIVGHESLTGFVRPQLPRPLVAKIHRDLLLHPKNDQNGVDTLEEGWEDALKGLFQYYTPLVIGYGGNDGSLMGFLGNLPAGHIPGRLFWCYREGKRPEKTIQEVIAKHNGILVAIAGFDEFMVQLARQLFEKFELESIATSIKALGRKRANRYKEQAEKLLEKLATKANDVIHRSIVTEKARQSISEASHHDENKWWTWELRAQAENDPEKREAIYRDARLRLPDSPELAGSYAIFLCNVRKDYDAAEDMFKKALELDPNHANITGNYAVFLADQRKDYDAAESMYKKALELDPNNADHTGNYAIFLADQRKDYDAAEAMYKKALELDPNHANNTGSYAIFLCNVRKDYDAAEDMYKKALELDPNDAINTGSYALFIVDQRNDYDAAEAMYKKALALNPNDAINTGNYAHFLVNQRKDYDAAEDMYKKALELDPNHANNTGSYASFLSNVRKDYDAAEAMFKKAREIDPNHAINTGNYANFLTLQRKDYDAAEAMYNKALAHNPNNANITGNYANFLVNQRKNYDAAEDMYKKALELDPNHAGITGSYANLLAYQRKDYDAADAMYKKALELDPNHACITGTYASFLANQRKDYDAAEDMFKKALGLDPNNANHSANFASLLLSKGDAAAIQQVEPLVRKVISLAEGEPSQAVAEALLYGCLYSELSSGTSGNGLGRLKNLLSRGFERGAWDFSAVFESVLPKIAPERQDMYRAIGDAILNPEKLQALDDFPLWCKTKASDPFNQSS